MSDENNEKKYMTKLVYICPECRGMTFKYDPYHDELYCWHCGLILEAPYTCHVDYPGKRVLKIKIPLKGND